MVSKAQGEEDCIDTDRPTCASYQGDCEVESYRNIVFRLMDSTYCENDPCSEGDCCLLFVDDEMAADQSDCDAEEYYYGLCSDIGKQLLPECAEDDLNCVCPSQNCEAWQCCEDVRIPACRGPLSVCISSAHVYLITFSPFFLYSLELI